METRQELLIADYQKFLSQQKEIIRQYLDGKKSTKQIQEFIEGRNPFDLTLQNNKVNIVRARVLLGKTNVVGQEEINKAFGIKLSPEQIPDIPFSEQELIRAKKLKQILVLGIDELADNSPATMKNLYHFCQPIFEKLNAGKVLYTALGEGWYSKIEKTEDFFAKDTVKIRWRLVDKKTIRKSGGINYLDQTKVLIDYLTKEVFADQTMPEEYQTAINEFQKEEVEIRQLMKDDWRAAAKRLSELQINQLCRRSPVEVLYDMLIYFLINKERLLENTYDWTNRLDSRGRLVCVGDFVRDGVSVGSCDPGCDHDSLGVCLSRGL